MRTVIRPWLTVGLMSLAPLSWAVPPAPTPSTLSFDGQGKGSDSFSTLSGSSHGFALDLSPFAGLQLGGTPVRLFANFPGSSGDQAFTPWLNPTLAGVGGADLWQFSPSSWSPATQRMQMKSQRLEGSVSLSAQPVPEPASYALLLLGLAGIAWIRRLRQTDALARLVHLPKA